MKFHKLFSIFIVLLLAGCSLDWDKTSDPNLPYWSTKLEFPISSYEVTLETLAEDSAITIEGLDSFYDDGQSNDSLFVFRKTIEINSNRLENRKLGNRENKNKCIPIITKSTILAIINFNDFYSEFLFCYLQRNYQQSWVFFFILCLSILDF